MIITVRGVPEPKRSCLKPRERNSPPSPSQGDPFPSSGSLTKVKKNVLHVTCTGAWVELANELVRSALRLAALAG